MTYVFMVVCFIALVTVLVDSAIRLRYRKRYGVTRKQFNSLSWPAQQIVRYYNKLPKSNRPFTGLLQMLQALDIQGGGMKKVNVDFSYRRYDGPRSYGWHHSSAGNPYRSIYHRIESVHNALEKQNRVIELAGIESGLDAVDTFIQMMQEEQSTITYVTKSLAEDFNLKEDN